MQQLCVYVRREREWARKSDRVIVIIILCTITNKWDIIRMWIQSKNKYKIYMYYNILCVSV